MANRCLHRVAVQGHYNFRSSTSLRLHDVCALRGSICDQRIVGDTQDCVRYRSSATLLLFRTCALSCSSWECPSHGVTIHRFHKTASPVTNADCISAQMPAF